MGLQQAQDDTAALHIDLKEVHSANHFEPPRASLVKDSADSFDANQKFSLFGLANIFVGGYPQYSWRCVRQWRTTATWQG
jgi:hypothetical protein